MAANELRAEESEEEEEELPTLASLLQLPPSPPPPPWERGRRSSPPPAPKAAAAAAAAAAEQVVVVVSSESEDDEVEVVEIDPLPERIKRRVKTSFEPLQPGCGNAAGGGLLAAGGGGPQEAPGSSGDGFSGTRGAEKPSLCLPPASPSGSADQSLVSGASPDAPPPPKKSKYTHEERAQICRAAWKKRKEREAQRRQQEEEKKRKRALAKMVKAQRPLECQEYVTVLLDTGLLQVDDGEQILSALQAKNYFTVVVNQSVPCSITWNRKTVSLQMEEEYEWTEEPNVLVLLRLEEFLSMVHNYKQEEQGSTGRQKETLQSYVTHVMEKIPGKILSLAVVGVENYFRSLNVQSEKRLQQSAASGNQEEEQRKLRKRKAKGSDLKITRTHVQEALVDLQLSNQVHVSFFESWKDLGEFATIFTKAVSEAPYKREQANTEFPFYLEKEWCGGVKVDHSGNGLFEVWKRQIQQFNRVSLEVAEAIVSAYPSPQLLIQAYNRCPSEQERENLLANILVHRGDGVTATCRRVGPDISRRIYLQMTSYDPDLYLDFTG